MRACNEEGCGRRYYARGYCRRHYDYRRRTSAPEFLEVVYRCTDINAYIARNSEQAESGCIEWTGTLTARGYGLCGLRYMEQYRQKFMHRINYELKYGPIPDGAVAHHKCSNKRCINPEHIQIIDNTSNVAEMFERRSYQARIAELEAELKYYTKESKR